MSTNDLENKLLNYYKISKQLLKEDRDKLLKLKLNELTIINKELLNSFEQICEKCEYYNNIKSYDDKFNNNKIKFNNQLKTIRKNYLNNNSKVYKLNYYLNK